MRVRSGRPSARVLVVDDDELVGRSLQRMLDSRGYRTDVAASLSQTRAAIARAWRPAGEPYACALVDLRLPDGDGEELLPELLALKPKPGVAVVSGILDADRASRLLAKHVWPLPKPVDNVLDLVGRVLIHASEADPLQTYGRVHHLSPCELKLIRMSAGGLRNAAVAVRLGCSPHTTAGYWQRIFHKTGQRTQAAVLAAILRFACGPAVGCPPDR